MPAATSYPSIGEAAADVVGAQKHNDVPERNSAYDGNSRQASAHGGCYIAACHLCLSDFSDLLCECLTSYSKASLNLYQT